MLGDVDDPLYDAYDRDHQLELKEALSEIPTYDEDVSARVELGLVPQRVHAGLIRRAPVIGQQRRHDVHSMINPPAIH
jgi:hypothetical protein